MKKSYKEYGEQINPYHAYIKINCCHRYSMKKKTLVCKWSHVSVVWERGAK